MEPGRCEGCGGLLPSTGRSDKRFHDSACRVVAHRRREQQAAERAVASVAPPLPPHLEAALAAAIGEVRLLALVAGEAKLNWRAAVWLLERQWPERWGPAGRASRPFAPAGPVALDDLEPGELSGGLRVVR
jgi:hypothetical protein